MSWKLSEWNNAYSKRVGSNPLPMTKTEIEAAIKYLRESNYQKPEDCPEADCPKYRPACRVNICRIAVGMCQDF